MLEVPYVGWVVSVALLSFEALLVIGNDHGRRLGDEIARTQVLERDSWMCPIDGSLPVPDGHL